MPVVAHRPHYRTEKRRWKAFVEGLMAHLGINASDFAALMGVSRQAVSQWRDPKNHAVPTPDLREKMVELARSRGLIPQPEQHAPTASPS